VIPGQHGHDPSDPAMQGLFIIQGPQIKRNQLDTVRNIDVYNLLVRLLKVVGEKNDGQDTLYDLVIK
jgi:predicted AlkP superfamily pyrophosphatase or phosphodiesterase